MKHALHFQAFAGDPEPVSVLLTRVAPQPQRVVVRVETPPLVACQVADVQLQPAVMEQQITTRILTEPVSGSVGIAKRDTHPRGASGVSGASAERVRSEVRKPAGLHASGACGAAPEATRRGSAASETAPACARSLRR